MSTITFTTDFGLRDWYVGVMKGVIENIDPTCKTIDITHGIKEGAVEQAAFVLAWSYSFFPKGTIHIAVVDPGVGGTRDPILLESQEHYFVGPDNGIFSLVNDPYARLYVLDKKGYWRPHVSDTFHGRDIFAPIAAYLARGMEPHQLGSPSKKAIVSIDIPKPKQETDGSLRAQIIHVDRFGNCLTNVPNATLKPSASQRIVTVHFSGQEIPCLVAKTYEEATIGKPIVIHGSSGFLELSINQAKFSEQFHLHKGDQVSLRL